MKHYLATIFVTIGILAVFAETQPVNQVVQEKKPTWDSLAGVGLTLTRGNSDTLLITASLQTQKKTPLNELMFLAQGSYGMNNNVKNIESLQGSAQYNRLFSEQFFGYIREEALHDGIADLDYRFTTSPGVGYYLIKETNTTLAVENGPAVINERLGGVDDTYATWRLAERFEHKFPGHKARIWQNVEILPQVNDLDHYLVNAEVGIESAISKKLSLQVSIQDNYANQPAPGRKANDLKLISGLTYKF